MRIFIRIISHKNYLILMAASTGSPVEISSKSKEVTIALRCLLISQNILNLQQCMTKSAVTPIFLVDSAGPAAQ